MFMKNSQGAVVAVSGGMDSATVLALAISNGYHVIPVTFKYGSKHNPYEREAAHQLCRHYDLTMTGETIKEIDLTGVFETFQSALLDDRPIPEGHYEAENMKQTVVPGRNIIFASVLAGVAWSVRASYVFLGIHAGDHFIYPDCRPEFLSWMRGAIFQGTDRHVQLEAPFISVTKKEILQKGFGLGVPYNLTRTCYKDQPIACGKCGSCQERLAAFAALGVEDPINYESRELLPK